MAIRSILARLNAIEKRRKHRSVQVFIKQRPDQPADDKRDWKTGETIEEYCARNPSKSGGQVRIFLDMVGEA